MYFCCPPKHPEQMMTAAAVNTIKNRRPALCLISNSSSYSIHIHHMYEAFKLSWHKADQISHQDMQVSLKYHLSFIDSLALSYTNSLLWHRICPLQDAVPETHGRYAAESMSPEWWYGSDPAPVWESYHRHSFSRCTKTGISYLTAPLSCNKIWFKKQKKKSQSILTQMRWWIDWNSLIAILLNLTYR